MLRCIAGFEAVQEGEIRPNGKVVSRLGLLPPEKRRIGMVFQDYALFPHLRIADNIAQLYGLGAPERAARPPSWLSWSGWRTCCRSTCTRPAASSSASRSRAPGAAAELLLLDEPFNLDVELRERLSHEVRDIIRASGAT